MIKTCLVDDHKLFSEGLERLLAESRQFEVLRKFHNAQSLLEGLAGLEADLLVIDIEMPGMNGLDTIKRIQLNKPSAKIVILSMHEENVYMREAYELGAYGYLCKSIEAPLLIDCLLRVYNGERMFPVTPAFEKQKSSFSKREEQILKLIARGKTSEQIAAQLNISHLTVKAHRRNMMRKVVAKNSSELVTRAMEKGLL